MSRMTDRIRAFARHYVANGGNATQAALAAGYAPVSASQYGSILTHRLDVQAEIALVRSEHASHRQLAISSGSPPRDGEVYPPGAGAAPRRAPMTAAERLTRAWLVEMWVLNAEICLGIAPIHLTVGDVVTSVTKHDSAGANRALELLEKQLAILAEATPDAADPDGLKPSDFVQEHRDKLANMREHLRNATKAREARQAGSAEAGA